MCARFQDHRLPRRHTLVLIVGSVCNCEVADHEVEEVRLEGQGGLGGGLANRAVGRLLVHFRIIWEHLGAFGSPGRPRRLSPSRPFPSPGTSAPSSPSWPPCPASSTPCWTTSHTGTSGASGAGRVGQVGLRMPSRLLGILVKLSS